MKKSKNQKLKNIRKWEASNQPKYKHYDAILELSFNINTFCYILTLMYLMLHRAVNLSTTFNYDIGIGILYGLGFNLVISFLIKLSLDADYENKLNLEIKRELLMLKIKIWSTQNEKIEIRKKAR